MFEWDVANVEHIAKRNITPRQVEQAMEDLSAIDARAYSTEEERRNGIVGQARDGVLLYVVYTVSN